MRTVLRYFRQHPWQRRALTLSAVAILGVTAAWMALPIVRDLQILAQLRSEDPFRRERGINRAVEIGRDRPQLVERIEQSLDSTGDLQFSAMVDVLNRLGKFQVPGRKGEQLDRYCRINFVANLQETGRQTTRQARQSADVRRMLLHGIILDGRDNVHVRKVLQLSARDLVPEIRSHSALLGARLGDDTALLRLLGDAEGSVRTAAAIDAALAGRSACAETIAKSLKDATTDEEQAAFVQALARLEPKKYAPDIADMINRARLSGRGELLEKLLSSAPLTKSEKVAEAVVGILRDAHRRKEHPPATALIAAGKMGLQKAKPFITRTIADLIARPSELTVGQTVVLAAAVNAAGRLNMPPRLFIETMEKLWHPETSLAMILSAEAIGKCRDKFREDPVIKSESPAVLRSVSGRSDTPVPAAAAVVALFRLTPHRVDEALRIACESETYLAGDYVAWNLARGDAAGRAEAWRIAGVFFGPGIYNKSVRSNAAMTLAMLARGTDRAGNVARAVENRLKVEIARGEYNPFTSASYRCALLVLGRREFAEEAASLAKASIFPKRRALTALVLSGEPAGFDLVFTDERFDPVRIDSFLTGRLMARVYFAVLPEMPAFDIDAPEHVRHRQCRMWRDYYLIHRQEILNRLQQR